MDLLVAYCRANGMPLSSSQVSQFEQFRSCLYELNKVMNLTRVPFSECELRHFVDSLLVAPLIPSGSSVLDVGTGPGFPAWPLACARPDLQVMALDSSSKMLRALSSMPLPNLVAKRGRAESPDEREAYDFVTGRAVAPLAVQLEVSAAWARVGGAVVPFRTPTERESFVVFEAGLLGLRLQTVEERALPGTEVVRLFPVYRKVRQTPSRFPRAWAEIRKQPLR